MPYKSVIIELSGKCNAKCQWCVTGIKNRRSPKKMPSLTKNTVMPASLFEKIVAHLFQKGIADRQTTFGFYNWGEPFLNPELGKIFAFMYQNGLKYDISTNASVSVDPASPLPRDFFRSCALLILSFCGFSQAAYDRIHGFRFEAIRRNAENLIRLLKTHGLGGG